MIALLDYGSGNLRSVHKALLKVGAEVRIAREFERRGNDAAALALYRKRALRYPSVDAWLRVSEVAQRLGLLREMLLATERAERLSLRSGVEASERVKSHKRNVLGGSP